MTPDPQAEKQGINIYRESALHMALKAWFAVPGDRFEVLVDGHVVDVVRDDLLIEIQTGSFANIKTKLTRLLPHHRIRLVYPIPQSRWIIKVNTAGETLSRRRSPKKADYVHLFKELVYIYPFMQHENLSFQALLIHDEEIRTDDGRGSWRRGGWSITDRRLSAVVDHRLFESPSDFLTLLPPELPSLFTTAHLAAGLKQPPALARKMAYCLREMGLIEAMGKQGRAILYSLKSTGG
ncbi:MAG: hypothetical protein OHK0046_05620 [Anaerolineae bacterium]